MKFYRGLEVMPALNFMAQFAFLVEQGSKLKTIRPKRKKPIKPGDTLYLYTGLRTKSCRLLRVSTCSHVSTVEIYHDCVKVDSVRLDWWFILDIFANRDGFDSWNEMMRFFKTQYGLPFVGNLIEWNQ